MNEAQEELETILSQLIDYDLIFQEKLSVCEPVLSKDGVEAPRIDVIKGEKLKFKLVLKPRLSNEKAFQQLMCCYGLKTKEDALAQWRKLFSQLQISMYISEKLPPKRDCNVEIIAYYPPEINSPGNSPNCIPKSSSTTHLSVATNLPNSPKMANKSPTVQSQNNSTAPFAESSSNPPSPVLGSSSATNNTPMTPLRGLAGTPRSNVTPIGMPKPKDGATSTTQNRERRSSSTSSAKDYISCVVLREKQVNKFTLQMQHENIQTFKAVSIMNDSLIFELDMLIDSEPSKAGQIEYLVMSVFISSDQYSSDFFSSFSTYTYDRELDLLLPYNRSKNFISSILHLCDVCKPAHIVDFMQVSSQTKIINGVNYISVSIENSHKQYTLSLQTLGLNLLTSKPRKMHKSVFRNSSSFDSFDSIKQAPLARKISDNNFQESNSQQSALVSKSSSASQLGNPSSISVRGQQAEKPTLATRESLLLNSMYTVSLHNEAALPLLIRPQEKHNLVFLLRPQNNTIEAILTENALPKTESVVSTATVQQETPREPNKTPRDIASTPPISARHFSSNSNPSTPHEPVLTSFQNSPNSSPTAQITSTGTIDEMGPAILSHILSTKNTYTCRCNIEYQVLGLESMLMRKTKVKYHTIQQDGILASLKCPGTVSVLETFILSVTLLNHTGRDCDLVIETEYPFSNERNPNFVCKEKTLVVGPIPNKHCTQAKLHFIALSEGHFKIDKNGLRIVDKTTNQTYICNASCEVLVLASRENDVLGHVKNRQNRGMSTDSILFE